MSQRRQKSKLTLPKWMDCSWRRVACERDDCPICSRLKKTRTRHQNEGVDPDSADTALSDLGHTLKEALAMIKEDAKRHGINITNIDKIKEPPGPDEFPLYRRVRSWRDDIYDLAEGSDMTNSTWLYTESAEDLLWYANTILAKTYRQLCNRWHLERKDPYGEEDFVYTGYVLSECLRILHKALSALAGMEIEQKKKFALAGFFLSEIEKDVKAI